MPLTIEDHAAELAALYAEAFGSDDVHNVGKRDTRVHLPDTLLEKALAARKGDKFERLLERFCEAAQHYYQRRKKVVDKAGRGIFIWIVDLVRFAVATGMRKGKIRHLRWSDIDMEQGRIYVRSREGFQTKVGSDCTLPIFPMTTDVLRLRKALRRSENPDELVFAGPSGKRLGKPFALRCVLLL